MAVSGRETTGGKVVSVVLFMVSIGVLSVCLSRRVANVRDWGRLPIVCWLVIVIYVDSMVFIMGASIISHGFDMESKKSLCGQAILLCLACYMTTKFIYYFLVERAYIISGSQKPRFKDKLYIFNSCGMLIPYCVVIALNFYFRFANFEDHTCRIGLKKQAMIPLIAFDILVNIYLTSLFLLPLRSLYSYKMNRNSQARSLALRTFIGSCCTLISSVVNLTVVMVLKGEPGWICLMCCNVDILFSVLVLHWITSKDNASTLITSPVTSSPSNSTFPVPPLASPTYLGKPKRLVPRAPLSDLEAFEFGLRELKRPGVMTRVTADGNGSDEIGGLGLQRIRTRQSSLIPVQPGVVTVEIEHQRTVESVGVCGIDLDGNEIAGYGADPGSAAASLKTMKVAEGMVEEPIREEGPRMERRGSGWVREGRLMAERIAVGGDIGGMGSRAGLVAGGAPMEKLDS